MDSQLLSRIFWTLFVLESIGFAALMLWKPRSGPEGPVGEHIVYIGAVLLLGLPLAIVLIGRSRYTTLCGILLLSWPIIGGIVGPIYSAAQKMATNVDFFWPSQRKFARAVQARDVEAVRALLPKVGNLNTKHPGGSLFGFAMQNADSSFESREIIRALLAAGANPAPGLFDAMRAGPAMTEMLITSGADPNRIDQGMPVWWDVLYDRSEQGRATLAVLLNHGADLSLKDGDVGPVGRAASLKNWRAVWLLMERGALWKHQLAYGQPIASELAYDLKERQSQHFEIPDEMEKIRMKLEEE